MEAEEIMPEDCAKWLRFCTMTYGIPPREGAFVRFAQLIADAAAKGERVPTCDELCEYFKGLHWHDASDCRWYADAYAWLVRAFLYQKGRMDISPFTMERYE